MSIEESKITLSDEFLADIVEDTKINDLTLREECRHVINRTQRYIEEYFRHKRKLKEVEALLKKKKGELFEKYKYNFEIQLSSSSDVMIFVERDSSYQKVLKIFNDLETIVDFLERTIKNMNNKGFMLQKMVELEKMGNT